ncbi:MAG TPA: P2 family phage major capsid protein, partial [Sphingopyxis sp.]|nr:P2 family phage major capsid protein [Sphingopyxis sp.]
MTHLSTRGRDALDRHYANIAQINNTANVHRQFNIDPTVEQRLEDLQTESVEFLNAINIYGVRDLKGQTIGMGANNFVGSRTSA